jgi:hypothetical protein
VGKEGAGAEWKGRGVPVEGKFEAELCVFDFVTAHFFNEFSVFSLDKAHFL